MGTVAELFRVGGFWAYALLPIGFAAFVIPLVGTIMGKVGGRLPSVVWLAAPCAALGFGAFGTGIGINEGLTVLQEVASNDTVPRMGAKVLRLALGTTMLGGLVATLGGVAAALGAGASCALRSDDGSDRNSRAALLASGVSVVAAVALVGLNLAMGVRGFWAYLPGAILFAGLGCSLAAFRTIGDGDAGADRLADRYLAILATAGTVVAAAIAATAGRALQHYSSVAEAAPLQALETARQAQLIQPLTAGVIGLLLAGAIGYVTFLGDDGPFFDSRLRRDGALALIVLVPMVAGLGFGGVQVWKLQTRFQRALPLVGGDIRVDVSRDRLLLDGEPLAKLKDGAFRNEHLAEGPDGEIIVQPLRKKAGTRIQRLRREQKMLAKEGSVELLLGATPGVPQRVLDRIGRTFRAGESPGRDTDRQVPDRFVGVGSEKGSGSSKGPPIEVKLVVLDEPLEGLPEKRGPGVTYRLASGPKGKNGSSGTKGGDAPGKPGADDGKQSAETERGDGGAAGGRPAKRKGVPTYAVRVRSDGFSIRIDGTPVPPLEGCAAKGPTICLRGDGAAATVEEATAAFDDGAFEKGQKLVRKTVDRWDFRRLYTFFAGRLNEGAHPRVLVHLDPDLPAQLTAEVGRHLRRRLPEAKYSSRETYRTARDEASDSAAPALFSTLKLAN